MDTRFLETFLMAVDHGSIAETARRLNLTAAAVAKQIRALESEIGAVLVTRSGRTIRPTEAGAAIVERARRFLIEARDFKAIAAADRPSGQLRIGAFPSALSGLLPDILALMKEKYPQIDVQIASGVSSELYRKVLDADDLDAAIIGQPPFAIPKSCNWRFVARRAIDSTDESVGGISKTARDLVIGTVHSIGPQRLARTPRGRLSPQSRDSATRAVRDRWGCGDRHHGGSRTRRVDPAGSGAAMAGRFVTR